MYVVSGLSCSISHVFQKETTHKCRNSENDSENDSEESDSDSDSEELPPNLVAIETPESEDPLLTDKVPGPSEDAGGDVGRAIVGEVQ